MVGTAILGIFAYRPVIRHFRWCVLTLKPLAGVIVGVSDVLLCRPFRVEGSDFVFRHALADIGWRKFLTFRTPHPAFNICLALTSELIPVIALLARIFVFLVWANSPSF